MINRDDCKKRISGCVDLQMLQHSWGLELGIGLGLGDGEINEVQHNYSVTCCDIHRSAYPQFAFCV